LKSFSALSAGKKVIKRKHLTEHPPRHPHVRTHYLHHLQIFPLFFECIRLRLDSDSWYGEGLLNRQLVLRFQELEPRLHLFERDKELAVDPVPVLLAQLLVHLSVVVSTVLAPVP